MEKPDFLLEHFQQKLALIDGIKNIIKGPTVSSSLPAAKKNEHQHHGLAHYVLTLFKFLERFCIVPFQIEPSIPNGDEQLIPYRVVVSKWKKKLIKFLMTAITLYHIYLLIKILRTDGTRFFTVIRAVINFSLVCWSNVTVVILWKRRNSIMKIISRIDQVAKLLEKQTNVKILTPSMAHRFAILLTTGCVIISVLEILVFSFRLHNIVNCSFYTVMASEAKELSLLVPTLEDTLPGRFILVIAGLYHSLCNKLYYFNIGHFGYAVLFTFSYIMSKLMQTLNSKVMLNSSQEIEETLDSYVEIRKLLALVNSTIGSMMAWGIIAHLPYNAYKVKDLIDGSAFYQISYIIHYIMYVGILLVAARVNSEVQIFVERLSARALELKDRSLESRVILISQQAKTTGMKGKGLFVVTYGFLGNIIGVILTYAILIVQFQKN